MFFTSESQWKLKAAPENGGQGRAETVVASAAAWQAKLCTEHLGRQGVLLIRCFDRIVYDRHARKTAPA